uniref:NADH dehydrogenase [ubiquinone] 1 alpha subcomplex subunit 3 n=1 Tax=Oncorhynchus tshawytscha TaxID=74940 RepID=A0A8C8JEN5_ONCTS
MRGIRSQWYWPPVQLDFSVSTSLKLYITAVTVPLVSPLTKYSGMMNAAVPYNYPVPVRNNGKMDDVPSHPCDPKGPNLDWIKSL